MNPHSYSLSSIAPDELKGNRVLLINPPWKIEKGNLWKKVASSYPSLGLALLAAFLEKYGAEVRIIDMQVQEGTISLLDDNGDNPPDFVGITATTVLIESALSIARMVKKKWPQTKVLIGGVHATIRPQEVLLNDEVDFVIRGEGERSFAMLVAGLPYETIRGLSYKKNGVYTAHPDVDIIENLDEMPMPSYHLLPMHLYRPPLGGALRTPTMSIFSTRGCPGECTYCNSSLSKRLRFQNAVKVVDEIQYLMKNYSIREVSFYDDTFCASRKRVQEICRLMLSRKMNVSWTCMSRINYADEETLAMMAKAGCHMICYGVESSDKKILQNIKKRIDLEMVPVVVRMTQKAGIRARLSFMLGNPGETISTMKKSIDFAIRCKPDLIQLNVTTPYPGTEMFHWADHRGLLTTKDWSQYDLWNVVMRLPGLTEEDIHKQFKKGYRRFYLSPSFLWKYIINLIRYPGLIRQTILNILQLIPSNSR